MSDCRLLLRFNGADAATNCIDATGRHGTITFHGTAQLDTAIKKFGTASLLLDGDSDYLTIANSLDWQIVADNTEDWTIELWVKHDDHAGIESYLCFYVSDYHYWHLFHSHGNGITFVAEEDNISIISTGYGGEITDSRWHHVALCKIADEYGIYLDGQQVRYLQDSSETTIAGTLKIGYSSGSNYFDGHIDNVTIWKGNPYNAAPNSGKTDTIDILNPVAHYTLDDDAASTTVLDSSGNGFDGTLAGGDDTEDINTTGQVDGALDFDGAADYVNTGQTFQDVFQGSFSISILVKPDDGMPGTDNLLWGMRANSANDVVYSILYTNGKVSFHYGSNANHGNPAITDAAVFSNGAASEYTHIVYVADSTVAGVGGKKIYINGSEVTLNSTYNGSTSGVTFADFDANSRNIFVAARDDYGSPAYHFNGKLDDCILFDKALTAAEVLAIYNATQDGESGVTDEYEDYELLPVFPTLSRSPDSQGFVHEPGGSAVSIAAVASGYPFVMEIATFDGAVFSHTLSGVSDADKVTLTDFYDDYKARKFRWSNPQDSNTYIVQFARKPNCSLMGVPNIWQISMELMQVSSTVI